MTVQRPPTVWNLLASARDWLNAALALVYPEVCQLCHANRATPPQGYVCDDCRGEVQFITEPYCDKCCMPFEGKITGSFVCSNCRDFDLAFSYARAAARAKGKLLDAIHGYKYHAGLWFEPFLAGLLTQRAAPQLNAEQWDLVVPVPLYPAKQRHRGFNQAERLGRHLSHAINLPLDAGLVRRLVATKTQTHLTREERRANVSNAFAVPSPERVRGKRVVLVDDVFTTGATTSACAGALIQAGAAEVCVWTVARGI